MFSVFNFFLNIRFGEYVGNFEFSPNGDFIAYSYSCEKSKPYIKELVIKDVKMNRTIFKKNVRKDIIDMMWGPQSKYIAILSKSSRFSVMPWHWFSMFSGHPVVYNDIQLEIFNLKGDREYNFDILRNKKNAGATLVWTKKERE